MSICCGHTAAQLPQPMHALGMTQRDLSRLTGYSMCLIGEVERGKEHVAADKLLSIPDVLNMTMTGRVEGK